MDGWMNGFDVVSRKKDDCVWVVCVEGGLKQGRNSHKWEGR